MRALCTVLLGRRALRQEVPLPSALPLPETAAERRVRLLAARLASLCRAPPPPPTAARAAGVRLRGDASAQTLGGSGSGSDDRGEQDTAAELPAGRRAALAAALEDLLWEAWRLPPSSFARCRPGVAAALLLRPEGAAARVPAEVRRRTALAYAELLTRHGAAPADAAETHTLLRHLHLPGAAAAAAGGEVRPARLPLLPSGSAGPAAASDALAACCGWETLLGLLEWREAAEREESESKSKSGGRAFVSSNDVYEVYKRRAREAGLPSLSAAGAAPDADERLERMWAAARAAEEALPVSAVSAAVGRAPAAGGGAALAAVAPARGVGALAAAGHWDGLWRAAVAAAPPAQLSTPRPPTVRTFLPFRLRAGDALVTGAEATAPATAEEQALLRDPPPALRVGARAASLAELRRRRAAAGRLPAYLPHDLLRFDRAARPYMHRCPAREWLPWMMLASAGAAARQGTGAGEGGPLPPAALRALAEPLLAAPAPGYAAWWEHTAQTLVHHGLALAGSSDGHATLVEAVRALLGPPYSGSGGSDDAAGGAQEGAAPTPADWAAAAADLRNYRASVYLEALAQVSPAAAARELACAHGPARPPLLLAPESATAVLTALLLLPDAASGDGAPPVERLYFACEGGRTPAYYLAGLHRRELVRCETPEPLPPAACARGGWGEVPALLAGRSRRYVSKYPTTAAGRCHDGHAGLRGGSAAAALPSRPRVFSVDVAAAWALVRRQRQQQQQHAAGGGGGGDEAPSDAALAPVVLADEGIAAYGLCAVHKPAGVASTLHLQLPSLAPFVQARLPWRGAVESVPGLHQLGLVNRIDVGTSGVVLLARRPATLAAARAASLRGTGGAITKRYRVLACRRPGAALPRLLALSPAGVVDSAVLAAGGSAPDAPDAVEDDVRAAATHWRVLERFPRRGVLHLEVTLARGRRHQIRQHLAGLGLPLLGDRAYGYRPPGDTHRRQRRPHPCWGLARPALHAREVVVRGELPAADAAEVSPLAGQVVVLRAPLPPDMQAALRWLRNDARQCP